MADVISKGTLFPEELIPELIQQTVGASALAKLCAAKPIPFNGQKEFTFTLDKEIDVVAENGAKTKGGATVAPVTIVPVKVEYGARVSDEFLYAAEDARLDILTSFAEGFARKVARGLDLMAFHGVNPRTGSASSVIGTNHFDSKVTQTVTIQGEDKPDDNIEAAVALVQGSEREVNGLVLAPVFKSELAKQKTADGAKLYPQLAWGSNPGEINGLRVESNTTLSANSSQDRALVGDFINAFRWGYAKEIPVEVIKYGNPDNDPTLGDLKGHNQVYLRAEAYIGWGILDPSAFAFVKAGA
ncbi:phage major capsid protein [Candidatus Allofournierella merdipullorum]|uniref:phage major capsid protein n=1 Tax=Candidatus Allofournierella merdipullorum TaxID=2838595 RepID=UPI002A8F6035|nr:phage major capsid protein [Candidatus Fournierella merdipullorum]